METWTWRHGHGDMDKETWTWGHGHRYMNMETMDMKTWDFKRKDAQAIFLNPFSSCKRKFVVCPFVGEETNGSYPFANGLNGQNGFAHL